VLKAYPLPEWLPDQVNNVLTKAINVRAIANGYAPVKGSAGGHGGTPRRSTAAVRSSIRTAARPFSRPPRRTSTNTRLGMVEHPSVSANQVVRFAQFGDNILIANGGR
jgi:hypothetical protein